MNEVYFPHGVWMHIRSYMPIWKNAYNRVMAKISHYHKVNYSVYTSATKSIRFKKEVCRHHFIGKHLPRRRFLPTEDIFIIIYELIPPPYLLNPGDPILEEGGFGKFELD